MSLQNFRHFESKYQNSSSDEKKLSLFKHAKKEHAESEIRILEELLAEHGIETTTNIIDWDKYVDGLKTIKDFQDNLILVIELYLAYGDLKIYAVEMDGKSWRYTLGVTKDDTSNFGVIYGENTYIREEIIKRASFLFKNHNKLHNKNDSTLKESQYYRDDTQQVFRDICDAVQKYTAEVENLLQEKGIEIIDVVKNVDVVTLKLPYDAYIVIKALTYVKNSGPRTIGLGDEDFEETSDIIYKPEYKLLVKDIITPKFYNDIKELYTELKKIFDNFAKNNNHIKESKDEKSDFLELKVEKKREELETFLQENGIEILHMYFNPKMMKNSYEIIIDLPKNTMLEACLVQNEWSYSFYIAKKSNVKISKINPYRDPNAVIILSETDIETMEPFLIKWFKTYYKTFETFIPRRVSDRKEDTFWKKEQDERRKEFITHGYYLISNNTSYNVLELPNRL